MEKYSAFRDPGTGIQPFSTPIPAAPSLLEKAVLPFRYLLGVIRTLAVFALLLVYLVFVQGICLAFALVPPLHRIVTRVFTSVIARLVLLVIGFVWIPVDHVTRTKGRQRKNTEAWDPQAGDIIVSNWVSWVEILWLAFRFNPILVMPASEAASSSSTPASAPITYKPGKGKHTTFASHTHAARSLSDRTRITGFHQVSLLTLILHTGRVPPYSTLVGRRPIPLEDIRKTANRPVVIFPECTTSNGKGMLRFAHVFEGANIPVKDYNVYVMCVRCDPPTTLSPTLTHSIPSSFFNPLPHLLSLTTSLLPLTISIRLLAPSESPSSPLFMVSEVVTGYTGTDQLSEACAVLIAGIGKMKRTGMGWEDKARFLELHQSRRR